MFFAKIIIFLICYKKNRAAKVAALLYKAKLDLFHCHATAENAVDIDNVDAGLKVFAADFGCVAIYVGGNYRASVEVVDYSLDR